MKGRVAASVVLDHVPSNLGCGALVTRGLDVAEQTHPQHLSIGSKCRSVLAGSQSRAPEEHGATACGMRRLPCADRCPDAGRHCGEPSASVGAPMASEWCGITPPTADGCRSMVDWSHGLLRRSLNGRTSRLPVQFPAAAGDWVGKSGLVIAGERSHRQADRGSDVGAAFVPGSLDQWSMRDGRCEVAGLVGVRCRIRPSRDGVAVDTCLLGRRSGPTVAPASSFRPLARTKGLDARLRLSQLPVPGACRIPTLGGGDRITRMGAPAPPPRGLLHPPRQRDARGGPASQRSRAAGALPDRAPLPQSRS